MPASDYRYRSGQAVHAAEKGQVYANMGRIFFVRGCQTGLDANLFATLKICVDEFKVALNVNSLCTGKHSKNSRHYAKPCLAADCNRIGPTRATWQPFTEYNPYGIKMVEYLLQQGWMVGEGDPARPGLLLGPPRTKWNSSSIDHSTHLHLSIARWAPGSPPEAIEQLVEPTDDV
jgi:hypothetical protein